MIGVDVLIPCYNYGRFLVRCVDSALSQYGVRVRVLIIDDNSTDGSVGEAHRIAALDPRVSVIAHPLNRGHIATYNEGIAWASAEYMVLLSADDLLAPLALSRSVCLMAAQSRVGFVFGPLCQFNDSGNNEAAAIARACLANPSGSVIAGRDFVQGLCRKPHNVVPASGVVVRTALQQRLGGYLPELTHAGDLEMWLRLAAHADVGVLKAPTALTRIHTSNMRNAYYTDQLLPDYRQRALAFHRFFEDQSDYIQNAGALARTAKRSLAEEVLAASDRRFDHREEIDAARLAVVAREIDPTIVRSPRWWKAAAKRAAGWDWCQNYGRAKRTLRGATIAARQGEAP